jgi:hypothetical protein
MIAVAGTVFAYFHPGICFQQAFNELKNDNMSSELEILRHKAVPKDPEVR